MIVEDTARLDRLVSRLLELARVEDDRGAALPVDLAELARACAGHRWPMEIEVAVTGATVVPGRAPALASAIENLVANAMQHAEPDTRVHLVVEGREDGVRVIVANHGAALSPAARAGSGIGSIRPDTPTVAAASASRSCAPSRSPTAAASASTAPRVSPRSGSRRGSHADPDRAAMIWRWG